ncbi:PIN-like domain-containing protein [Nonomuraea bangladeshensis]
MRDGHTEAELKLLRQYWAWIRPGSPTDEERKEFFAGGTIVLDTNVLLDLYQYTPNTRQQLLDALGTVSDRLWMPYQVGLEFVRGRAGVIKGRVEALHKAPGKVSAAFTNAWKQINDAVADVKQLLEDYAGDQDTSEIDALISEREFNELMHPWRAELVNRAKQVKDESDFGAATFVQGRDTLLPQIAALFGDRIGDPPEQGLVRERIELAIAFRFPNKIPPGFADTRKDTDLRSAGDFLLWEELIEHAQTLSPGAKVILVSRDTKKDWYQPEGFGQEERPWPQLIDEFERRTSARLLIAATATFYSDVKKFLGAEIASSTIDELNRPVAAPAEEQFFLTRKDLARQDPPEELALAAYRAAGLSSKAIRQALARPSDRLFQWWLVGATRDLGLRESGDEPLFDLQAILRPEAHPGPGWVLASEIVQPGELPYLYMSLAPWFVSMLEISPMVDRTRLLRLAQHHGSATGFGAPDQPNPGSNSA